MTAQIPPGIDLSTVPLATNPNGAPPNFVNAPSLYPAMLGTGISLMVLSGMAVILRVITNLRVSKRLEMDDSELRSLRETKMRSNQSAIVLCIVAQVTGMAYWIVYHNSTCLQMSTTIENTNEETSCTIRR